MTDLTDMVDGELEPVRLAEGEHAELIRRSSHGRYVTTSFGSCVRLLPEESNRWAFAALLDIRTAPNKET